MHLVPAAGQAPQHPLGVRGVAGLPEDLAVDDHRRVGAENDQSFSGPAGPAASASPDAPLPRQPAALRIACARADFSSASRRT